MKKMSLAEAIMVVGKFDVKVRQKEWRKEVYAENVDEVLCEIGSNTEATWRVCKADRSTEIQARLNAHRTIEKLFDRAGKVTTPYRMWVELDIVDDPAIGSGVSIAELCEFSS